MKKPLLLFAAAILTAHAAPPAVGTTSELVAFEKFVTTGVENSSLSDHEGKIIIVTYFTPW